MSLTSGLSRQFALNVIGSGSVDVVGSEDIGSVRIVADARSGKILGGHMVAPAAGELIYEIVAAMTAHAVVHDIPDAIHTYPTFAEGVKVAAGEGLNARQRLHNLLERR